MDSCGCNGACGDAVAYDQALLDDSPGSDGQDLSVDPGTVWEEPEELAHLDLGGEA